MQKNQNQEGGKMKKSVVRFVSICCVFALLGTTVPSLVFAGSEYDDGYKTGKAAAKEQLDQGKKAGWVLCGFAFGIIGTGIAYLHKPKSTAKDKMSGDDLSEEYKKGFTDGFCQNVTKERGKYALGGWGAWMITYAVAGGGGS
jgi:hypothetical protein